MAPRERDGCEGVAPNTLHRAQQHYAAHEIFILNTCAHIIIHAKIMVPKINEILYSTGTECRISLEDWYQYALSTSQWHLLHLPSAGEQVT